MESETVERAPESEQSLRMEYAKELGKFSLELEDKREQSILKQSRTVYPTMPQIAPMGSPPVAIPWISTA